jgi:hypothetical protein
MAVRTTLISWTFARCLSAALTNPEERRDLNPNCNHDLKNLFEDAATVLPANRVHFRSSYPSQKDCHDCVARVEVTTALKVLVAT